MTSQVEIYRLAASHIGQTTPINSPTEKSAIADICGMHFLPAVKALQQYPYAFLVTVRALASLENDWPERYAYCYDLPGDMIKLLRIIPAIDHPDLEPVPYALRGGRLYCDLDACKLEYTRLVTDPTKFPDTFVDALAWELAARICFPITRDQGLRKESLQAAMQFRLRAEGLEANDHDNDWQTPASHLEARQ